MKRILVPFDFSPYAIEALKFAGNLASKEDSEVIMLHAIELPAMVNSSVGLEFERKYMEVQRARAIKSMGRIADRLVKGIKIEKQIDFGGTVHAIERTIKNFHIDMVVMGTRGASGLKELTVGSNTQKIARRSSVPVIAVRKAVKQIDNIVLPVPPEGEVKKEIVDAIKNLQELFGAKLHVLFVNTPFEFGRDANVKPALEAFVKRHRLDNATTSVFNDTILADGIINFTKDLKRPMVAMGTHGRKGIRRLSMGSIAEDVLNHIECPIATFRLKN